MVSCSVSTGAPDSSSWPAGSSEIAASPCFSPIDVAGVEDRRRRRSAQTLEQVADRAGLAVGRLVGRGSKIGEAEAEFLVLGADAELLRRLAAGGDVVGQLPAAT